LINIRERRGCDVTRTDPERGEIRSMGAVGCGERSLEAPQKVGLLRLELVCGDHSRIAELA
jgi:hypothetical protein